MGACAIGVLALHLLHQRHEAVGVECGTVELRMCGLRLVDCSYTIQSSDTSHSARGGIRNGETMSKLLRGLAAGYGAKKMGGGCLSTIVIFIILWWLLGNFDIFK